MEGGVVDDRFEILEISRGVVRAREIAPEAPALQDVSRSRALSRSEAF
jgi:hypothetical protein